jgi:TonB family protein
VKTGAAALALKALAALAAFAVALPAANAAPAAPGSTPVPSPASCVRPDYPREAVRYELEGITTLRYRLAPDGRVAGVQVLQSSGWGMLDEAVIRSLQACRFTPAQAAKAGGAALPVKYVWSLDGEHAIHPHLVPGSCRAGGRFAGFKPYDDRPSGADGIKLRLLVDPSGKPRGVRTEGAALAPALADALVEYVESCRFGFDPALKGERTDTVYGRVLLR